MEKPSLLRPIAARQFKSIPALNPCRLGQLSPRERIENGYTIRRGRIAVYTSPALSSVLECALLTVISDQKTLSRLLYCELTLHRIHACSTPSQDHFPTFNPQSAIPTTPHGNPPPRSVARMHLAPSVILNHHSSSCLLLAESFYSNTARACQTAKETVAISFA